MVKIPAKVKKRLIDGIKKFKPILVDAKRDDLCEADTSRIVQQILKAVLVGQRHFCSC